MKSLPRLSFGIALLILLVAVQFGRWQVATGGTQVQVPMFYDTHYVFPRPWTQAQEVPGVPNPAPLAIYQHNQLSQTWRSGSDQLRSVAVWLWSTSGTPVSISLQVDDATYAQTIEPAESNGRYYRMTLPQQIRGVQNRPIILTIQSPQATVTEPLYVRTVGGDRLGGILRLNQFPQAATLDLKTYSGSSLTRWWQDVLSEQLLPSVFQLRLQQYKPAFLKGNVFGGLLLVSTLLSAAFVWLSLPKPLQNRQGGWWLGTLAMIGFLVWQIGSGRLLFGGADGVLISAETPPPPPLTTNPILSQNLASALWQAERKPEERFFDTTIGRSEIGEPYGHITTPAQSALGYSLRIPFNSQLRLAQPPTQGGAVFIGGTFLEGTSDGDTWLYDLTPYGGQTERLTFQTETASAWANPQIETRIDWLQPYDNQPIQFKFANDVNLLSADYADNHVILNWHVSRWVDSHATVFVHVLNAQGEIVAQHDSVPVLNTYPIPLWQPNAVVLDRHPIGTLPSGAYTVAVGLYDPNTQIRFGVTDSAGNQQPNDQVVFESLVIISAE